MTYEELASHRGISRDSATRLAMRHRWARRRGNDGKARVAVPLDHDASPPDIRVTITPDSPPDESRDVRVIGGDTHSTRELVEVLRAQVIDLTRRLDASEADRRSERAEWQAERGRLLALVETMTARLADAQPDDRDLHRIGVAELRAAEAERLLAVELAELHRQVAALAQPRRRARPGFLARVRRWTFLPTQ